MFDQKKLVAPRAKLVGGPERLPVKERKESGIASTFMTFDDVLARIDAANAPAKVRGPYRKRLAA